MAFTKAREIARPAEGGKMIEIGPNLAETLRALWIAVTIVGFVWGIAWGNRK